MLIDRTNLKYLLPILSAVLFVLFQHSLMRAGLPASVRFTADTILSLEGVADGDLYAANNSECGSLSVAGKNLAVDAIPEGAFFTLKTPQHDSALRVYPTSGSVDLDFSGDDLLSGEVASWSMENVGAAATVNIVWGVPAADTLYAVKVNGAAFDSFRSDAQSEMAFRYDLSAPSVFTLELDKGGSPFIAASKPDTSGVNVSAGADGNPDIANIPQGVIQIAVSTTSDFSGVSWEDIADKDDILARYGDSAALFIKFRSKSGAVSDVVEYMNTGGSAAAINEGDIVKTADSPDVYIIKYKNGKRYKRLVLSPRVFDSYGHLRWGNIKTISQAQLDGFIVSDLVRTAGEAAIYELFPASDTGERKLLGTAAVHDADSVYEINAVDRDSYVLVD